MTAGCRTVAVLVVALGLAGCSSGPGGEGGNGAAGGLLPDQEPSFELGSCDVTISGARSLSYRTPGGWLAFTTDYWLTDAQTRELLAAEALEDEMTAEDDVEWFVDQGMSRDPRYVPMAILCLGPDATVSLVPGSQSRYGDVPFRAHSYEIAPVTTAADAIAGNFAALVSVLEGGESVSYGVTEPGTLDVEVFHRSRIEGTFSFQAVRGEGADAIQVAGRFNFRRPGPAVDDEP